MRPRLTLPSLSGLRRVVAPWLDALALRVVGRPAPPVWYDAAYRLPLADVEARAHVEPRRADFVAWYLLERRVLGEANLHAPPRVSYAELARVHTPELLESLTHPDTLARVFAVDPGDLPVDELLGTIRLACGGTVAAARAALRDGGAAVNLLGGFHHAAPGRAGGLCPVNDLAVAVAALRDEGFAGRVVVLDLDAHPPDGTAACFAGDGDVWLGSLSASDWGPLPGVDEVRLPDGCGDDEYLRQLEALLGRMPRPALAFVVAGGDVLAGDRLGRLGLSLEGARRRDERVAGALAGVPTVWLPGGGYHPDAWKVLCGTVLCLAGRPGERIPPGYDPLGSRYALVAGTLSRERLGGGSSRELLTWDDLAADLGVPGPRPPRLLHFYTAEGIEQALFRYGVLAHVQRLGYDHFRVALSRASTGDRMQLLGRAAGREHVLFEVVLERRDVDGAPVLFVHWLALRHPRAAFSPSRPRLPGQDVPGLGMARESGQLLGVMATRLGLDGIVFRPSWYHVAYTARRRFRFVDPGRQARFEALVRDLAGVPLLEATLAVAEGRVRMNGEPYAWEADDMAYWLRDHPAPEPATIDVKFTLS